MQPPLHRPPARKLPLAESWWCARAHTYYICVYMCAHTHTLELTVTIPEYSGFAAKWNQELNGCAVVVVVAVGVTVVATAIY